MTNVGDIFSKIIEMSDNEIALDCLYIPEQTTFKL